MDRLVRGSGGLLRLLVVDDEGDPVDAPQTPTVTVVDGAGTQVATGTATHTGTGVYTLALTGAQTAQCDTLTVTWSAGVATYITVVEVIGGWPVTLADIRNANTELADTTRYPSALLAAARNAAMDRIENSTGVAWSTRRARVTLDGDGSTVLALRGPNRKALTEVQTVLGVTVEGAVWDPDGCVLWPWGGLAAPDGLVWPVGRRNITVDVLHGVPVAPAPVCEAIVELAIGAVVEYGSRVPERATSVSTDLGTFRLTLPGRDGPTGIPRVDAVIDQWGYKTMAVG